MQKKKAEKLVKYVAIWMWKCSLIDLFTSDLSLLINHPLFL